MIPIPLRGYSLVFIPLSWAFGVWRKSHKTIYALGPFRFAIHNMLGPWKFTPVERLPEPEPFKPDPMRGAWLKGPSPSERLTDSHGGPTNFKAGGALEPILHKRAG